MAKRILVIEDEALVRDGIVELLESEGFEVIEAGDGTQGLLKAQQNSPDLILCDVMMPGLNGFQVLDALQQEKDTATIPFIFLTAKSERSDMRYGMELGADDFITKPFKSEELFNAVKSRLNKSIKHETKSEDKLNDLRLNIATILPHELRTPLNGILASSQLLLEYADSMEDDEITQLHENIHTSAKRLNRLIINYLYYSELELVNIDKSRINYFKKMSYLNEPSVLISDTFKLLAKTYNRESDLHFDFDDAQILIYEDHLQKIIDEVADNAFKFSEHGQKIIVKTHYDDYYFIISVQDFGRGLTQDQIKQIGAYVQFNRNIYEQQGSGLGLIISQKLLGIYDGKFTINSEHEEFTEILITIPRASTEDIRKAKE